VHHLYAGPVVTAVEAAFPGTTADGVVNRKALGARVLGDADGLIRLEAIVHPLVRAAEATFRAAAYRSGATLAVLDIPLLFETGADMRVDVTVVVSAPPQMQRARVLARPGMTAARLDAILARQMTDMEKRRRAHLVLDSSGSLPCLHAEVASLIRALAPMLGKVAVMSVASSGSG
jgi:dephospho-CoA kinase